MDIPVIRNILEYNEAMAGELREFFQARSILVLNLISSPGSGKTSLLERTLTDLRQEFSMAVIEGDPQTDNDARRVAATGALVAQINTEGGCHLNAAMVRRAFEELDPKGIDILFVENVGNLVCPVEFDLGEDAKVGLLSVTEGDDKPEKYPGLFQASQAMVVNKTDLLPYVDFDLEQASRMARGLNAELTVFPLSCRTGEGLDGWYDWIRAMARGKK